MIRKCKRCGKEELIQRKKSCSEYCRNCQKFNSVENKRLNRRCIDCGEKTDTLKCPHCNKVVKYFLRCKKCRDKYSRLENDKKYLNISSP